jgi:hypothetical protein
MIPVGTTRQTGYDTARTEVPDIDGAVVGRTVPAAKIEVAADLADTNSMTTANVEISCVPNIRCLPSNNHILGVTARFI